jgi:uncharacterized protein YkwD
MEASILTLINNHRAQNGLPALTRAGQLDTAARNHSQDMATRGFFSHNNPDGKTPRDRIVATGYSCTSWTGENIAAGYSSAEAAFNGWKNSSGHNANMLRPEFDTIGIGVYYLAGSSYGYYWTTTFGGC